MNYMWDWSFGSFGADYHRTPETYYIITDASDRTTTEAGDYIIIG